MSSVSYWLNSEDPLSRGAFEFLLAHDDEDVFIDYKKICHPKEQSNRFELLKDVTGFANCGGGYLLIGKQDFTWEPVGVDKKTLQNFQDAKGVFSSVNKYLSPEIHGMNARVYESDGKNFVLIHIPRSSDIHFIKQDIEFDRNGKTVRWGVGQTFVRKVKETKIAAPEDLRRLADRYLLLQKEKLLGDIVKVVSAEPGSVVEVVARGDQIRTTGALAHVDWRAIEIAPTEIRDVCEMLRKIDWTFPGFVDTHRPTFEACSKA